MTREILGSAAMQPSPFVLFGRDHLIVLALALIFPVLLGIFARFANNRAVDRTIRWLFAALLIGNWIFWFVAFRRNGWLTLGDELPLNLCDWANIAIIIALLTGNQRAYELGYFWALAGTLQGLLTPDTQFGFPEVRFIIFSIFHAGIIAAVLYMAIGSRFRPYWSSLPRVAAWSLLYAVVAGLVDWQFGVNYGFLRAKPANVSLLDMMPPWPGYIPILFAMGIASMFVYYAPFAVIDFYKRRRQA
jgi:hypothetical integral membrane protein (TIGR02206 family)